MAPGLGTPKRYVSRKGGAYMADYYITIFLDDEKRKVIEQAGLGDQIVEIGGKKAIQVGMSQKEQKKLIKGYPDLKFDSSNACVLPENAEATLMGFITSAKSLDVIKAAIMKLYNPLAGKELRSKTF
jgi:hypothetical protein